MKNPQSIEKLLKVLMGILSADQQPAQHWRYTLMASAMLLFLLPPVDAPSAEVRHALRKRMLLSPCHSQQHCTVSSCRVALLELPGPSNMT
jgi:hypothetical protein